MSATGKKSADPSRFQGDGVTFRAKIIGITDVPELKGDKMCFDAMQKLKLDVVNRGEHKPRIFIGVGFEGVKIRKNESDKPGELLHHHEVKFISFIWRDPTDARAFGYITALSADTKRQFVAIKTEKAADQVISTLKELFQAIIDMRQKESTSSESQNETVTETVTNNASTNQVTAAPPQTAATEQPPAPEQAEPAVDLFGDWPVPEPKKEENFFDMLLAPPPEKTAVEAPKAAAPTVAAVAMFPSNGTPAAGPWGAPVPPRAVPAGFPSGAVNPFFMTAAPAAFPGLNVGPTFTSAPPAAFGTPYAPYPPPQAAPNLWTPAPPAPAPVAPPPPANPFAVERGSAAFATQPAAQVNPFFGTRTDAPFFKDLVLAGKEMYGVWPDGSRVKSSERPKALHELVSARQQQQQPPQQQATQQLFGFDNAFVSTTPQSMAAPSSGNLLD